MEEEAMKKDKTVLIVAAVTAGLAVSTAALAESYTVIEGQPTNVIFVDPSIITKNGSKVDTAVIAILEKPAANGMVAQQINFTIDCDAKTMQGTAMINYDAAHKELGRREMKDPAAKPGPNTMGDNLMAWACNGKFKHEAGSFKTFKDAQEAASNIIVNARNAKARKEAEGK
jgi:hypothetical protein